MYHLFSDLKNYFKVETNCIDNAIFKLHYKITFAVLILFSITLTAQQYVGHPIRCHVDEHSDKESIMNTFCWVNSALFTMPNLKGFVGENGSMIYPGVGPVVFGFSKEENAKQNEELYHKYYYWVSYVLCLQAICFYFPLILVII